MTDTITFSSASPRFGLPLLFSGQSQKEVFVNEALALADALMHCAIEGSASAPPATAIDGTCWLVSTGATGDWAGMDGKLACRQADNWLFVTPRDGMLLLNRATGQNMRFAGSWKSASSIAAPAGGSTVDSEARAAINSLINALQTAGILSS
ncbi:DUF2793 domain-containing protein [Novosphingobium sp. FSY-8]|uniref:DUF2793 domain-containing protein n=1 Tax=Novosphingobium ovatum TaxID=1908523 RepID=A0ABW9XGM5_9SPHN|nr:DUF2793 domain-containing protein [Novosphingobium ovatum]NBC37700.1 DUF2793 domain-containing protein [Novosphingobium ovatum]